VTDATVERRLLWAGSLVASGLAVELAVSGWLHPLAFVAFLCLACPLVVAGMLAFLWAIVRN
jgi:hypothetical protein